MSIVGSIDNIAAKVGAVAGIKRAFATGSAADSRPIPRGIDDTPVAAVYLTNWELPSGSGNAETLIAVIRVDIWSRATDAGTAIFNLSPYVDLILAAIRLDMNLSGECTRSSVLGGPGFEDEEVNGQPFLVLPIDIEVYAHRFASDATA